MTGTSCDAIDAALVSITGTGLETRVDLEAFASQPLGDLGSRLLELSRGKPHTAAEITRLRDELSARCLATLEQLPEVGEVTAIGIHGQTIYHQAPLSWQLLNPHPITHRFGVPVWFDFRGTDLAAGGQGAPITPLTDWVLYPSESGARAIINLGGFANFTWLPSRAGKREAQLETIAAGDICPCNQLLDDWARLLVGLPFDRDGALANSGRVAPVASAWGDQLDNLRREGRSLGTGDERVELAASESLSVPDQLRSLVDAIARTIRNALTDLAPATAWILAGGGVRNAALVAALTEYAREQGESVELSDRWGVPAHAREAMAMAMAAQLAEDGVPLTLSQVTGARFGGGSVRSGVAGCRVGSLPGRRLRDASFGGDSGSSQPASPLSTAEEMEPVGTEASHPRARHLEQRTTCELVEFLVREDATVQAAIEAGTESIQRAIDLIEPGFVRGGRLIYVGAGTSGRLGVLDASECPPTFGVSPERVQGIIAGGIEALVRSSEHREDEREGAIAELRALELGADDAVVGISASGRTPFVLGALDYAASLEPKPRTILVTAAGGNHHRTIDHVVELATGPEIIAGSTRLKAGTATKRVLNTISTVLMTRAGFVYDNLMVDLRATNQKLQDRALRIVETVTGRERHEALSLINRARYQVKPAIVMAALNIDFEAALDWLAERNGRLDELPNQEERHSG